MKRRFKEDNIVSKCEKNLTKNLDFKKYLFFLYNALKLIVTCLRCRRNSLKYKKTHFLCSQP